jgi:anti-sigma-K factor RskA
MNAIELIESGLLELNAMGIATEEEQKLIIRHLTSDQSTKAELDEIEICLEKLARYYAIEPDSKVKSNIEQQIWKTDQEINPFEQPISEEGRKIKFYQWWPVATSILFFLMAGFGFWGYKNLLDTQENLTQVKSDYENLSVENQSLYNDQQKMVSFGKYLNNEGAVQVMLHSTKKDPMKATLFWNPKTHEIWLVGTNLPKLPEGKQYQMWGIVDGKPTDAGVFNASSQGTMMVPMKPIQKPTMFAVTVENQGGSTNPTMNSMCLMAEL